MPDISKKIWQDTRPSDCKGTGIGEAADNWKTTCIAVGQLKDSPALADAGTKNKALITTIATARTKLEKSKSDKKYEATKALLADWDTKTKAYATNLANESARRMQVELAKVKAAKEAKAKEDAENLAAANKEIDQAFTITQQKQTLMNGYKTAIKDKVTALAELVPDEGKTYGMAEEARAALLNKVGTLINEVVVISKNTSKISEELRKELAPFRLRGATGIAKDHGVDEKTAAALTKRFNEQKALMDKFELDAKTIGMLAHKANVDSTAIETRLVKGWETMTGYKKVLEQVLHGIEETTKGLSNTVIAKNPGAQLKSWAANKPGLAPPAVELQIQACQSGIDLYRKAEKRLEQLTSSGLGHVPRQDLSEDVHALRKKIEAEMAEFSKEKAAFDKEANDGIAHGKTLVTALNT